MKQPTQGFSGQVPYASRWTRILHGILICLLLTGLGVIFIAEYETRQTVSTTENRRLAVWPELTQVSLLDGSFARAVELYVADHFPLREIFTEIASLVKTNRGLILDGRVLQVKGGEAGFEDVNSWAKPQTSLVQEISTKDGAVDTEITLVTPGLDREANGVSVVSERSDVTPEPGRKDTSRPAVELMRPATVAQAAPIEAATRTSESDTEPKPKPEPEPKPPDWTSN